MEMKDAPLVQEEIASSKVKSLRKVAITVAVVALTVCGVAVGMVAAGMESKNVPTLKYTPGTKTTYNHVLKAGMGANGDMNMEPRTMAVEQYVLNTDAAGATTFLVNIPVTMFTVEEGSSSAESTPVASYVITQASNGAVNWAEIKTNVPMDSEFYSVAAKTLVHHMSMVSPRLAQDATVSEVDSVIGKQVDARYTVNNLEEGSTEVVRTVAPAGVANQVNGQQLYAAASKTVTIKDGEVVAAKSTGASENSVYFEKKGTSEGEVGYYRDSRQTYTHDASMTKAATEAFDLAEFANELAAFQDADLLMFAEAEYEAKAPFVVGTGMEGSGRSDAEAEEEADEEARSLLAFTVFSKKNGVDENGNADGRKYEFKIVIDFSYSGPGGSKSCEQRGDTYYNQCSAKRGFTVSFKVTLELVGGTFSFTLTWGKSKETSPGNNVKKVTAWTAAFGFSTKGYSVSLTLLRQSTTDNKDCNKNPPEKGTPEVPVPGMSVGPLGLKFQIFFQAGYNISPSIIPSKSKTSGYGCVRTTSNRSLRRHRNTGSVYSKYNSWQWNYLPEISQWDSNAYPSMMGFMKPGKYRKSRYYVQLSSYFYSGSGCTLRYSTHRTRFVVFATFMAFMEVGVKVSLSSPCIGWRSLAIKYEAGCTITGRFWSVSVTGGFYLLIGAGDCWYITYAQNGATLTIQLFFNKKYHKKCKKSKPLFQSLVGKFKKEWKAKQNVGDHLAFWKYPWLVYPCMSSNPGDCNPKSNSFTKVWLYSGACHSDNYMLEPHYGGRKQFYTYK